MKINYRPEIDGLRALSVFAVIFYLSPLSHCAITLRRRNRKLSKLCVKSTCSKLFRFSEKCNDFGDITFQLLEKIWPDRTLKVFRLSGYKSRKKHSMFLFFDEGV